MHILFACIAGFFFCLLLSASAWEIYDEAARHDRRHSGDPPQSQQRKLGQTARPHLMCSCAALPPADECSLVPALATAGRSVAAPWAGPAASAAGSTRMPASMPVHRNLLRGSSAGERRLRGAVRHLAAATPVYV